MSILVKEVKNDLGKLKIVLDSDAESPRNWDNLSKLICFHKRYDLGDSHDYKSDDYRGWEEMKKEIIKKEDVAIIMPLYLYDHSGITISTTPFSCPWDSGQLGFAIVTKPQIRKAYSTKRVSKKHIEAAQKILLGEIETYDQYLCGEIYGFELEDEIGNIIDSCYGFYNISDMDVYIPKEFNELFETLKKDTAA